MAPALRRLLPALAASLALAAPAHSQELRIAMGADVTSMDPHYVNLFPNNNIAEHFFEKLITLDPDSRLIPGLAESWKTVDPTTWEFKLRKGVKFHDGSDLTAADVAFSIASEDALVWVDPELRIARMLLLMVTVLCESSSATE